MLSQWLFGNLPPVSLYLLIPVQRKSPFLGCPIFMIKPNHTINSGAVVSLRSRCGLPISCSFKTYFRASCHEPFPLATIPCFIDAYRFVFTASSSKISVVKNSETRENVSFPQPSGRLTYTIKLNSSLILYSLLLQNITSLPLRYALGTLNGRVAMEVAPAESLHQPALSHQ